MLANGGWDLTLILLTWTIWRAPTNASKWRMILNSAFRRLKLFRAVIALYFKSHGELKYAGWNNFVGIATRLSGVQIPSAGRYFSLFQNVTDQL